MANHPSRGVNPEMASEVEGVKAVLVVKSSPASMGDIRDVGSVPGWEGPRRRAWQPTPAFLPGGSHGQRSLAGYGRSVAESDTTELT